MSGPLLRPFTVFNFRIELQVRLGDDNRMICAAEFAECDGLEMSIEPKTIREGGNNGRQIHLTGPVGYGQLTLKRGMTSNFDLWDWFSRVRQQPNLRGTGEILILPSNQEEQENEDVRFMLTGCLPLKLKAPPLNAKDGTIAIEEMQIAYETLDLKTESGG